MASMKSKTLCMRIDPATKRYIESAAKYDNRGFTSFIIHSALKYAEELRGKGWDSKNPPRQIDGRRKAVAS
jgi:hypothetical protein